MATTSAPFLLLALLTAVVDWIAVGIAARRLRPVALSTAALSTAAGSTESVEPVESVEPDEASEPGERAKSARTAKAVEYLAKPLTMVFLIIAALSLAHEHRAAGPHHATALVVVATVVALALSLVGDVFLMLPEDSPRAPVYFVAGLGSFLLAHVAYIVAFVRLRYSGGSYAISFVLVGVILAVAAFTGLGLRILAGAKAEDPKLGGPVLAYLTAISLMAVGAWWTGDFRVILGAMLFVFSDAVIGWTKFVQADRRGPVAIIVTYHLAQILLVLGLLRH